jgi:hypothetical protein
VVLLKDAGESLDRKCYGSPGREDLQSIAPREALSVYDFYTHDISRLEGGISALLCHEIT